MLVQLGKWIWRSVLVAIAILCALVIFAVTIPPDDITSNFSQWLDRLGFHEFAAKVSDKSADRWGVTASWIILAIVGLIVAAPHLKRLLPDRTQVAGMASQSGDSLATPIPRYRSVKVTQNSMAAYVRGSPRVKRIDDVLAADARLPIDYSETGALHREEKARAAGITNLGTLDRLLEENEDLVVRMSHYMRSRSDSLPCGFCIDRLFDVIMAKAGRDKFKEFMRSLAWSTGGDGWVDEIMAAYAEITEASSGVVSLWEAAQELYSETVNGPIGQLARRLKTTGAPLGYYCHFIKDSVSVFGNRPPSTTREKIDFTNVDIVVESHEVVAVERYGNSRWENLAITRADFKRVREEVLRVNADTRL